LAFTEKGIEEARNVMDQRSPNILDLLVGNGKTSVSSLTTDEPDHARSAEYGQTCLDSGSHPDKGVTRKQRKLYSFAPITPLVHPSDER
jgi:hypothetical protein